jgi:hypothetical protein
VLLAGLFVTRVTQQIGPLSCHDPRGFDRCDVCALGPLEAGISGNEWYAFVASQANALLVGPADVMALVWTFVWPALPKPVCWADHLRFWLPPEGVPTLIVQGADELIESDQMGLLDWLQNEGQSTRVLATARHPVFPLVEQGTFAEALYYRLNTLTFRLGPTPPRV